MGQSKKITLNVPEKLLKRAQNQTKEGISETVRRGLELVAAGGAYQRLRAFRGKVRFSIDLKDLRKDRR